MIMHFETVLDHNRQKLLPYFNKLPPYFYLVGGTGLALQLGRRISDDFDFFCEDTFNTHDLYTILTQDIFTNMRLTIIQESSNTLDVLTESQIKLSFIRYRYKLIYPLIQTGYFPIADFRDIAAMKLIATAQRSTQKDYFDLFFLIERLTLKEIFEIAKHKYPEFNPVIYLKSLTYFDECDTVTPRLVKPNITFEVVKKRLRKEAHALFEIYRQNEKESS